VRKTFQFSLVFIAFVPALLSQFPIAESTAQREIRIYLPSLRKASVAVIQEGFVDSGDGTVTDTKRNLMWQKGDNGKEVAFEEAREYCRSLRLGGYADWRLPKADERETAVVIQLLMPRHSRDVYASFDLYWTSNPTVLIPFNYYPAYGKEVSKVYYAREGTKAFVRAVRSLGTTTPNVGG